MFYYHPSFQNVNHFSINLESALVVLSPAESKRLIAKAVAILPEIQAVLQQGTLVITMGTTNAMVVEEIAGRTIKSKAEFARGLVCEGKLMANTEPSLSPFVLKDGKVVKMHQKEALQEFKPGDVLIKGANAIDANGNAGCLAGSETGGTVGDSWYAVSGRGGCFICPAGLEKLVPSVTEVVPKCNIYRYKYSMGMPVSLILLPTARVVTEIQAIKVLSGADASIVASGGIGGSEGSVVLLLEGDADVVDQAYKTVESIKGEPPVTPP